MKMTFAATAEHCSGQSVSHPCTTGIFADPTDHFQRTVEAESLADAEEVARKALADSCDITCSCQRRESAGSNSWWASVAIHLWPQDEAARDAFLAAGGDIHYDPHGLIPAHLKRDDSCPECARSFGPHYQGECKH